MINYRPLLVTVSAGFLMLASPSFASDSTEASAPLKTSQSDESANSSLVGGAWDYIEEYFWSRCDPDCESEVE